MSMVEKHCLSGKLSIIVRDMNGKIIEERKKHNLITNSGRRLLAGLLSAQMDNKPVIQIAVGDGAEGGDPNHGDMNLNNQVDIAAATITLPEISEASGLEEEAVLINVKAVLPIRSSGDVQSLDEAGIKITIDGSEPVLYNRATFPVVSRTQNMELTLNWELSF